MPNITFSSPIHKDKTVYAVAGSFTKTVLTIAQENHIPIDFSCGDGECGTCLVKVTSLEKKGRMAGPLTLKEVDVLKDLHKVTREELEKMYVDDLPVQWRLACQLQVRDEDLLIEYGQEDKVFA
ncbi:2Fe-2S iron-sulfur cluster-binding protein [Plasticicumulans acidivorans]|uniref:Ferredoxin n=1 Tax=Plasticicumulans acidivorans TaxID=886464 RepID=A0A317MPW9_9GAMM|nr:2Fe-2S iron-sulfur cluster-binding protein [Plasticicumulans acidivorans]PWV58628.1 ferredoxin [Plasticicumulans acidivorans]